MKLISIITLILISGCATQPISEDQSEDDMAVLHGSYWGSFRWHKAAINGYDGTDFGLKPVMMIKLMPGAHSISATCFTGFDMLTTPMHAITRTISFQAEAGHSYQIRCGADGSSKTFWIKDKSTGEVVGGYAP